MQKKRFYSPEEVGDYFGVSAETIRNLCRAGKIQGATQIGRQWRIPRRYIEQHSSLDETDEEEQTEQERNH
jgi:excisionase family DNA binding protein